MEEINWTQEQLLEVGLNEPDDFLKVAPGPILGPWGGQNRIPREALCRFYLFS